MEQTSEILIYHTKDNETRIETRLLDETVWLTQQQMSKLFAKDKRTISEHIRNIFDKGELQEASVVRKFRTVQKEGPRTVKRNRGNQQRHPSFFSFPSRAWERGLK